MQYVKYLFVGFLVVGAIFGLILKAEAYSPEIFAGIAGGALMLAFEYFPWVSKDYDQLSDGQKRLVMGGLIFLAIAGAFALSCAFVLTAFACSVSGALDAIYVFIFAITANQGTYKMLRKARKA